PRAGPGAADRRLSAAARAAADRGVRDAVLDAHLVDARRGAHGGCRGRGPLRRRDPGDARGAAVRAAWARERALRRDPELRELRLQEPRGLRRRGAARRPRLGHALRRGLDRGRARAGARLLPRARLPVTARTLLVLALAAALVPLSQARIDRLAGSHRAQE